MDGARRRAARIAPAGRAAAGTRGFTLIEVLVAVAIVGILVAVAVPGYSAWVTATRRTDATIFLTEVAGEQQRHFSEHNRYAATMAELGYADALSEEGYYAVEIARPTPTRFTLTATPVAGTAQAGDAGCTTFTLSSTGARGATGSEGREGCW